MSIGSDFYSLMHPFCLRIVSLIIVKLLFVPQINGKIYIFGGDSGGDEDPLATVEVYDTGEGFQSVDPTGKLIKTWGTIKKGDN